MHRGPPLRITGTGQTALSRPVTIPQFRTCGKEVLGFALDDKPGMYPAVGVDVPGLRNREPGRHLTARRSGIASMATRSTIENWSGGGGWKMNSWTPASPKRPTKSLKASTESHGLSSGICATT